MARARVSTGVKGLDELIEGGFPAGQSYLITGEPGTGKTTFAAQFILEGLKQGENGVYISIDEKPSHMVEDVATLGWDMRTPVNEGKLTLLDVSPYFNWVRSSKGGMVDANEVLQDLSKQIRRINAKRLVIDPVVPLVLHRERVSEVQEYIRTLIFGIDDNFGCTTLMTSHIWPGAMASNERSIEEFMVSGVIALRLMKVDEDHYVRRIFVRKMRGTKIDLHEYNYDIHHGDGLIVENRRAR
jgi:circadian clock protein KaiC